MTKEHTIDDHFNVSLIVQGVAYQMHLPNLDTDYIQSYIAQEHSPYEFSMLEDMRARLIPGDQVLDVGANIGNHTLYLSAVKSQKRKK
jgi:hypothetical protein